MDLLGLTRLFREGRVIGPLGPLVARRAMLTRKSLLLWTGDSVLKLRRPRLVDGFDQDRVSTRYGMTARERWLGRQVSPSVYLGDCVLQVVFDDSPEGAHIRLVEGLVEGEPVVAMRALDEERRADLALAERWLEPAHFFPVVSALLRAHLAQDAHRQPPFGSAERPAQRLADLAARIPDALWPDKAAFVADTIARIERAQPTLAHRVMEGRVRELHGEPSLDHVFLDLDGLDGLDDRDGDLGSEGHAAILDPHDGLDGDRTFDVADDLFALTVPLEMIVGRGFADTIVERYASLTTDHTLRKVAVIFRRLAALRLVAQALAEADDLDEPDEAASNRAAAILEHLGAQPD